MPLCPVVACTALSEHEVVWSEDLSKWSRPDAVHGARLQVHQDGSWNVLATTGFIVVHIDAFQLQI